MKPGKPLKRTALRRGDSRLDRSTPLGRGKGRLKRYARLRPKKRSRREFARVYGSEARVLAIKALPCVVPGCTNRPCDNAHLGNGGMSRKSGYENVVALCGPHHHELDDVLGSIALFNERHGIDLRAEAERIAKEVPKDG